MSKLYFYFSAMNAGKSTNLIQSSHNYRERGMRTLLLSPLIDSRSGRGRIKSRVGLTSEARALGPDEDLFDLARVEHERDRVACILIDEAQFLSVGQVWQAARVVDELDIPVLCYGLRTDFQGHLFPGSGALLGIADTLAELKTICHCGRKATMNLRVTAEGKSVSVGQQVEIGGNDHYVPMCRRHFCDALNSPGMAVALNAAPEGP